MNQIDNAYKLKEARQREIVEIITRKQSVTVHYLARTLFSSLTTIRRDLKDLHESGRISRIHGGATVPNPYSAEESHLFKESLNADKKQIIAGLAIRFLQNNQTIFLDGSTTIRNIIPYLHNYNNMVIITNSYKTVLELSDLSNSEIYLAGGKVIPSFNHTSGNLTVDFFNNFRAEICLMACKGISATSGCTVVSSDQALIKRTMIKNSRVRALMCDSSKFSKVYLFHFAEFGDFDYIITDQMPDEGLRLAIESKGCKVVVPEGVNK